MNNFTDYFIFTSFQIKLTKSMFKEKILRNWPHIVAILLIFTLSAVYFNLQFQGYKLRQMDWDNYLGMSKEVDDYYQYSNKETFWTNSMFSGMPAYQINMQTPFYVDVVNNLRRGFNQVIERPWGYLVIGMIGFYVLLVWLGVNSWLALIGAIAFGFSSINILFLAGGHNSKVIAIALIPPLIGALFYAFRKNYLIGALLVAVTTNLHVSSNHLQMTYYVLFMIVAIVLTEIIYFARTEGIALVLKKAVIILLAAIVGILPISSTLLSTYEYSKSTTRGKSELTIDEAGKPKEKNSQAALGKDYIKEYSMGVGETWSIVVPNIKGGTASYISNNPELLSDINPQMREMVGSRSTYWGEQRFSGGAFYFGAAIFLLFVLGIIFLKDRMKWGLLAVSALAVVLSWKYGAILDWFIDNFPGFNKFRDTKMMLILPQIAFPLIAILFVNQLVKEKVSQKKMIISGSVVIGVFVLFYLAPDTFFNFSSQEEVRFMEEQMQNYEGNSSVQAQLVAFDEALTKVRINIMQKDLGRTIIISIIAFLILFFFNKGKLRAEWLYAGLGLLILIDLWMVDKRYLNDEKVRGQYVNWVSDFEYYSPIRSTEADIQILNEEMNFNPSLKSNLMTKLDDFKNTDGLDAKEFNIEREKLIFRELNLATSYRVFTLSNPFANSQPSYFHKSIGGYHGAKMKKYQELIDFHMWEEYSYLDGVEKNGANPLQFNAVLSREANVLNMLNTKYLIYNQGKNIMINPYRYGNAWFVDQVNLVSTADDEILALKEVSPKVAFARDSYRDVAKVPDGRDTTASISLIRYLPNELEYSVKSYTAQFAVFSEIYYADGWRAYIGEEEIQIVPVNYVLRGAQLPEGEYVVRFIFEPEVIQKGRMIGSIGSLIILLSAGFVFFHMYRKRREKAIS